MAAKRFHIETPEQLAELAEYAAEKKNASSLRNKARVWAANIRRCGATPWDKSLYACFSGTRDKNAGVVHFNLPESYQSVSLRYNKALNWCEQHLREVYD